MQNNSETKMKIIDSHTHYAHPRFDFGRETVLSGLEKEGIVAVIEAAIGFESNSKMRKLAEKYPFVYVAVGCHPNRVEEMNDSRFIVINELLKRQKVIAIGETGLDYSGDKTAEQIQNQRKCFRRFISLSMKSEKPMIIHCREAYEDLIWILSEYSFMNSPGVVHCFSGDHEEAMELINMGFYLGVGGKFTRSEETELRDALRKIPLNRILLETDAPYLLPEGIGMSGKRNTSLSLPYIVEELAKLRGEEPESIYKAAFENTIKLYPELDFLRD